jgi:hypothetical protein
MRGKRNRIVGKNISSIGQSARLVPPSVQPLAYRNQVPSMMLLFSRPSTPIHDPHSERRHISVESGQLGK